MPSNTPVSSKDRFSDRVENYVSYRPSYPAAVVEWIRSRIGLPAGSVVADVGAGTGISAKLFLDAGCEVFAVEPNREMREAAERILGSHPLFHSVNGSAEETKLAGCSADLVVAAQAFHWFDARKTRPEFSRILKTEGHVALIWNEWVLDATPFLHEYEQLLLSCATDYSQVRHENIGVKELAAFFTGDYVVHALANEQIFDFAGLKGRLLSSSYVPAAGQPGHDLMLQELARIYERHQCAGKIRIEYVTRVYLGR
jgi:SAM-dependent methyltransferase